ncbi:arginine--tRNA ligase [Kyrpidia spormannii]|uniref:Arginyl-tRNA synthetase n=1 Tax=Kyrpidia spormannii TaxID=2055160 RepID=A0ACA8ZFP4_9BACL|nr:arginine--tRNA ligase [Kyrpidia spormannii]CAB3395782.1 arginyl-tRNA synthetase [Kyrpidia spormannii]
MSTLHNVQEKLRRELAAAAGRCGLSVEADLVHLEVPRDKRHGDYSSNTAMQLAKEMRQPPRALAQQLAETLDCRAAGVERVEVAGPGFLNFYLDTGYLDDILREVLKEKGAYGRRAVPRGSRVQVEFVSANPTGRLHIGHARGAAYGDALCRILEWDGYEVQREYYINDAGNQVHNLAKSLEARYFQALGRDVPMPEDGYYGRDVVELAERLVREEGDRYAKMSEEKRYQALKQKGLEAMLQQIRDDLARFRVRFDRWFSERSLYESGAVEETVEELRRRGWVYEADGALWFRSAAFGDDKDRVLIKSDGSYTYLTPDIAYHRDKLERGFDRLIDVWGQDHHGYVGRMKAAVAALGGDPERLVVRLCQLVALYRNGEQVRMSKRTGNAVTMAELMDEVGVDAARYFLLRRSNDSHIDFDLDLAVSQSNENPVYYVQYAHARICSILRQASERGYPDVDQAAESANLQVLRRGPEVDLLKWLGNFPTEVEGAAAAYAPHHIVHYLEELAKRFHSFYTSCRVLGEAPEIEVARLALVRGVQWTLRVGLDLLGVAAPEQM